MWSPGISAANTERLAGSIASNAQSLYRSGVLTIDKVLRMHRLLETAGNLCAINRVSPLWRHMPGTRKKHSAVHEACLRLAYCLNTSKDVYAVLRSATGRVAEAFAAAFESSGAHRLKAHDADNAAKLAAQIERCISMAEGCPVESSRSASAMLEIAKLRRDLAKLLDYPSYAALALRRCAINNVNNVRSYLEQTETLSLKKKSYNALVLPIKEALFQCVQRLFGEQAVVAEIQPEHYVISYMDNAVHVLLNAEIDGQMSLPELNAHVVLMRVRHGRNLVSLRMLAHELGHARFRISAGDNHIALPLDLTELPAHAAERLVTGLPCDIDAEDVRLALADLQIHTAPDACDGRTLSYAARLLRHTRHYGAMYHGYIVSRAIVNAAEPCQLMSLVTDTFHPKLNCISNPIDKFV